MRRLLSTLLFCRALAAMGVPGGAFFEQAGPGAAAWRVCDPRGEVTVLADGFAVRSGRVLRRFRWDSSMRLARLRAVQPLPSNSYVLAASGGPSRSLGHAARLRAEDPSGAAAVEFYFGPRGLEFNIELAADRPLPSVRLHSLDADLALDGSGSVAVDGRRLLARPVAFAVDPGGSRRALPASTTARGARVLEIETAGRRAGERLVIDPLLTYATYFAGSADEAAIGLRELPDGSVLFAGKTTSPDLPQGVTLTSDLNQPQLEYQRCFVARLSAATKRILFVSYLWNARTDCFAFDVDESGRILLGGRTVAAAAFAGVPSEQSVAEWGEEAFLARVSPDGRTLDYGTYLGFDFPFTIRAAPRDVVYLALSGLPSYFSTTYRRFRTVPFGYQPAPSSTLIARYNLALRRYDRATYFGDVQPRSIEIAPSGAVFLSGETRSSTLPLQSPVQSSPPASGRTAGFVASLSADLQSLLFSTYLGGQGGDTSVRFLAILPDGSLRLAGSTEANAIPGFPESLPFPSNVYRPSGSLVARISPGSPLRLEGFIDGQAGFAGAVTLANGRMCVLTPRTAPVGAIVSGSIELACLNPAENGLDSITAVGAALVAPSTQGGVWSLGVQPRGGFGDVIPPEFKPAAIQAYRPPGSFGVDSDDLVLRHIDLCVVRPEFIAPRPLVIQDYAHANWDVNLEQTVLFSARGMVLDSYLDVSGFGIPIGFPGAFTGRFRHVSPALSRRNGGLVIDLPAGQHNALLVAPAIPLGELSEPFPVLVTRLAPILAPFLITSNPTVFAMDGPVYPESVVEWNGRPLSLRRGQAGRFEVEIPAELAVPGAGELKLTNPPPGGGVQRVTVELGATRSSFSGAASPSVFRSAAEAIQVDRRRMLLYIVVSQRQIATTISAISLADGKVVRSATLPGAPALVVDLKLSSDGERLYFTDGLRRVHRFQTASLEKDLEFEIPRDSEPASEDRENRHRLAPLPGTSASIAVVTPAGRLIIYDDDRPRPYSTRDFPSQAAPVLQIVFAGPDYIYAEARSEVRSPSPCLIRYPVDALGFAFPEEFCGLDLSWGKYPEMRRLGSAPAIVNGDDAVGLLLVRGVDGTLRDSIAYDLSLGIAAAPGFASLTINNFVGLYRIVLSRPDTGESLGHFPAGSGLAGLPQNLQFAGADTLVYQDGGTAVIVPEWRKSAQFYGSGQ